MLCGPAPCRFTARSGGGDMTGSSPRPFTGSSPSIAPVSAASGSEHGRRRQSDRCVRKRSPQAAVRGHGSEEIPEPKRPKDQDIRNGNRGDQHESLSCSRIAL